MKTRCLIYFVCLIAILGLPALAFGASSDVAVMSSSGAVAVNGNGTPATTALFKGDKVVTADGAVVTISSPGSTVLIPSNSQMVFNGGVLDLTAGTASISTTKGMAAHTDKYTVAPATSGTAKFEVKKTGSSVLIHASRGVLNVSGAGKTFTLAEGTTVTLDSGTGTANAASHSAAAPGLYGAQSSTSFFNLEGALSDPSESDIPWCSHVALCHIPPSISGYHPCRCRRPL
jgi:hypothetical protein